MQTAILETFSSAAAVAQSDPNTGAVGAAADEVLQVTKRSNGLLTYFEHENQAASDRALDMDLWVFDTDSGLWIFDQSISTVPDREVQTLDSRLYRDVSVYVQYSGLGGTTAIDGSNRLLKRGAVLEA